MERSRCDCSPPAHSKLPCGSAGGRGGGRGTSWSRFGLAVGSLTLAGLPPTVGFVSEWFLLESLMQQFRVPGLGYRLVLALARAAVALTVGFAGVTFVRLVGLICLGRNDPPQTPPAHGGAARTPVPPRGWAGPAAVVVLALGCLATAAVTPLEIRVIAAGLSPAVPASLIMGALKSPWILQPVFAGFSILSLSWLWVEMPLMLLLVGLFAWAVSGRRLLRVRRVPASSRRSASRAPIPTPPSATPTPPAGCWPASPAHPRRTAPGHDGRRRQRRWLRRPGSCRSRRGRGGKDQGSDTVLPIWVGVYEANAIALEIEKVTTPRPMTHDLLKNLLVGLEATVQKVVVTELRDDTFFAVIWLERDGEAISVDSRPSDALALALRMDCPIFVEDEVLKSSKQANAASDRVNNDELRKWLENLGEDDLGRYKM